MATNLKDLVQSINDRALKNTMEEWMLHAEKIAALTAEKENETDPKKMKELASKIDKLLKKISKAQRTINECESNSSRTTSPESISLKTPANSPKTIIDNDSSSSIDILAQLTKDRKLSPLALEVDTATTSEQKNACSNQEGEQITGESLHQEFLTIEEKFQQLPVDLSEKDIALTKLEEEAKILKEKQDQCLKNHETQIEKTDDCLKFLIDIKPFVFPNNHTKEKAQESESSDNLQHETNKKFQTYTLDNSNDQYFRSLSEVSTFSDQSSSPPELPVPKLTNKQKGAIALGVIAFVAGCAASGGALGVITISATVISYLTINSVASVGLGLFLWNHGRTNPFDDEDSVSSNEISYPPKSY